MRLKLTKELYHRPGCEHPIYKEVIHAAEDTTATPEELEDKGYKPCNDCFPDRV